jgi:CRP-like cAMP-binding protein
VVANARKREFGRGEVVFHEGDPGDSMQVVVRGHLATQVTTGEGEVCMFRVFGPGEVFGQLSVAPLQAVRSMTAVSLDQSETLELFRNQLDELRAAYPSVNDALIGMAGLELHQLAERLVEALFVDADRRVRRRLIELGEQFRDAVTGLTVIPMTQEAIAELAGTSRTTVSRVLAEEQRRGTIVKRRRTIALLDAGELSRWASWPADRVPAALR